MKDMVGLLSLPVAEATSRARLRKVKVTHILISHFFANSASRSHATTLLPKLCFDKDMTDVITMIVNV